jgi:hypothetical protein
MDEPVNNNNLDDQNSFGYNSFRNIAVPQASDKPAYVANAAISNVSSLMGAANNNHESSFNGKEQQQQQQKASNKKAS